MTIKQYLLLLPVAAATLFAYCTKETPAPVPASQTATDDMGASDRTKCTVTVTVSGGFVQVCGTNTTLGACAVVNSEQLFGVAAQGPGSVGIYTVETAYGATPSAYLRFTNGSGAAIALVTVTTATGSVSFFMNVLGQTQNVAIDAFCVPTLI